MNKQDYVREKIRSALDEAKKKNPSFSLRAMARKIDINSGVLSSFLKGDRTLTYSAIEKVAYALISDPKERQELLVSHNQRIIERLRQDKITKKTDSKELTTEEFKTIKRWYHFAFLSLIHTVDFNFDFQWIAKRLNIKSSQAEEAVQACLELGLITITEDNKIVRTSQKTQTKDNVYNDPELKKALAEHHEEFLLQSIQAAKHLSPKDRDITAITIPTNPENFEKAREIIRKFQDDMEALLEDGDKKEVYRLCVQLYPITLQV